MSLKPFSNLEFLVSQCSNATPGNGTTPEKIYSSENYDIKEMHYIEIPHEFHTYAHIRADLQRKMLYISCGQQGGENMS